MIVVADQSLGNRFQQIRNETNESDDQKRTLSAKEAIDFGADIIVVGRPITSAKSPANAAESFYQSIT